MYIDAIVHSVSKWFNCWSKFSIKCCISVLEDCIILPNSADPDEMPHYVAFHQALHGLQKYMYLFAVIGNQCKGFTLLKYVRWPGYI